VLSCLVLTAKLYLQLTRPASGTSSSSEESALPIGALQDALAQPGETRVLLGTVGMVGKLSVWEDHEDGGLPRLERSSVLEPGTELTVRLYRGESCSPGDSVEIMHGADLNPSDSVTFQVRDGRYLRVVQTSGLKQASRWPAPFTVTLSPFVEGGEPPTGHDAWTMVDAPRQATDESTGTHEYASTGVAFFNVAHNVFMRLNDAGVLDVSAVDVDQQLEDSSEAPLMKRLPAGWCYERFTVALVGREADCAGEEGLRQRKGSPKGLDPLI